MLFFPKDLPYATNFDLPRAFQASNLSQDDQKFIINLNEQRRKYYRTFTSTINAKTFKPLEQEDVQNLKAYLFNTYDIMEHLCTKASAPLRPAFHSAFSLKVADFEVIEDNEVASTIEIVMSRYSYAFGMINSLKVCTNELLRCSNFEQLSKRVKHMLVTVEDACVRMAKLYYLKDIVWSGLEKVAQKYNNIAELNYFLIEAVFL